MHAYPTLAFIDRALGDAGPRFADLAIAPVLERRARDLAEEYWSDTVWLTGAVSEAAFDSVWHALELERATAAATTAAAA